jgi:hypothetical protein
MLPDYSYSDPSVLPFIVIPIALAAGLTWAVAYAWRRSGASTAAAGRAAALIGAGSVAWMTVTWVVADRGTFREWDRLPPSFAVLVLLIFIIAARLAAGQVGRRLAASIPLWVLVGVQGFRLPLEIAMHRMAERGIMPDQMSYAGRNFDIVTGITALVVAALVATGRAGRGVVTVWNVLGLGLLLNIITVAVLSTPFFAFFGPERLNVWVTYPPFVWLPAVMVLAALAGHLIIFRAVSRSPNPRVQSHQSHSLDH